MMKETFCLLIICLLTACSSIRYMEIETYNPADITYPEHVRKVLVVNNALPQPPDRGYEFKLLGVLQADKVEADSALFDACRALGAAIVEADYFDDVLLFREETRKDTAFLLDVKLTQAEVRSLCEETGADVVISFDRLLFDIQKSITAFPEGYVSGDIQIIVDGVARTYLPGRNSPAATVLVSDSIFFHEEAYSVEEVAGLLPATTDALRMAGDYIGRKIYPAFVPHWKEEIRWYYTGSGARWKEATAYVAGEKWENASERWRYIYNHSSRWESKAKSASNLALAYEVAGNLEKALEWAKTAGNLFDKNKGSNDSQTQTQMLYAEILEKRILNDKKLNLQFGEE
ncbi:MAG: DUF6340 family protein [Tannerellaceae bacterium]|jgi:hypothetical protein|nr:DUF6340 family protein [Tannerellaceae bacterium]